MTIMKMPRGILIAIEGVDRVGKSTLSKKLVESLKESGRAAEYIRFPDRNTPVGKLISSYLSCDTPLDDKAIHLLFAANRWEWNEKIKSLLNSGTSLVVDRYAYSGVAYSLAKGNMTLDWCKSPDAGLISADIVFYLTASGSLESRSGYGDEIYESTSFQAKVKEAYNRIRSDNWVTLEVDGLDENEVPKRLFHHVEQTIDSFSAKEFSYLWHESTDQNKKTEVTKRKLSILNRFHILYAFIKYLK